MNSNLKRLKLKLSEFKHRFCYKYNYEKMAIAMKKYKNCPKEEKKEKYQIKREINLLKQYWGCYPTHYFRYELYKKENNLTEEELKNYIPEFFFYNVFLPQFEDKKYKFLIEEKNITDNYFKGLNISCPKVIAKKIKNEFFDENMNYISIDNLLKKIEISDFNKIFFKPTDGEGGYGIDIFSKNAKSIYRKKDGKILDNDYLLSLSNDYIIQPGLIQDKKISEIYSNSINTFRIATENKNGRVRVLCATLRLGKAGSEVDNSAQGGIILGINIENGNVKEYAVTELCEKYYNHPDSKYIFKGKKIEKWDTIKKFAIDSAKKIPYFSYLGWDIALLEDEVVAIETNLGFGIDHYQIPLGGLRKQFNINKPEEFWESLR